MTTLTIIRPDDWHLHLRDGASLTATVAATARYFGRAIVMPNLTPPITNTEMAQAYRERILAAMPASGHHFEPLMVLYLTDNTSAQDIIDAKASGHIYAAKLYPAGDTTNSDSGVTDIGKLYPILDTMQQHDLPLLIHGEVTEDSIDIFDREKVFIERYLSDIVTQFPNLKIVLEHITTQDAAQFVDAAPANVAATITAHHLLYNRNHMLAGGIRPHYYCLPILKRDIHQQALIKAAISGSRKFFLGTDSAPHPQHKKEAGCGCAGCFTACAAIELYADAFEQAGALDKLEAFASHFGADFYGLARNTDTISLHKNNWQMPDSFALGNDHVKPLCAGETISWQII